MYRCIATANLISYAVPSSASSLRCGGRVSSEMRPMLFNTAHGGFPARLPLCRDQPVIRDRRRRSDGRRRVALRKSVGSKLGRRLNLCSGELTEYGDANFPLLRRRVTMTSRVSLLGSTPLVLTSRASRKYISIGATGAKRGPF